MMRSSSNGGVGGGAGCISIAASTKIVVVDNRISLRLYYRIADSLLRQADIYREEKNIIDLYIMLLRFSSLINETIPKHRDYQFSNTVERNSFKKKLVKALDELDALKPEVVCRIDQLNRTSREASQWGQDHVQDNVVVRHLATNQQFPKYEIRKAARSFGQQSRNSFSQGPNMRSTFSQAKLNDERIQKLSLSIPRAREETMSKHSILGPNGLHGQWQPPRIDNAVKYPSSLDLTPIEFRSMQPAKEDESKVVEDANHSAESVISLHDQVLSLHIEEPSSVVTLGKIEIPGAMNLVGQPSPPPVLAEVQDVVVVAPSQVSDPISVNATSLEDELIRAEDPLQVHISTNLMDMFMKLAKSNTNRNLETCGVLAGSLKNRKFYITSLIIPKQESTSDSCQTTNEEEIFEYQDKESLFPLGWIHTHPTQSCFMSSIDVHTHYSYQTMLPEAIAIVMAPKDVSRKHGIFRLTTPGGMSVIRKCNLRGFHPHEQPLGGGPIYDHCDVYMDPKLKFDVVDFR